MNDTHVLMIEDNPGDVVLVREAVEKVGLPYRICVARDGVEAMERLAAGMPGAERSRPDLIVLDLKLPRKNGHEVLADIAKDRDLRGTPIVVLSSSRSELEIVRASRLPNMTMLAKPSTFAGYLSLVKSIEAFRQEVWTEESKE